MITEPADKFRFTKENYKLFQHSNDRSNITLFVRKMQYTAKSYEDFGFLIEKGWKEEDVPPNSFMVFFDWKKNAEDGARYLRGQMAQELHKKVPHFHTGMMKFFWVEEVANFRGDGGKDTAVFGFAATNSSGMVSILLFSTSSAYLPYYGIQGLDIPHIKIVV